VNWYRRHACSIKAQDYFFAHSPVSAEDADIKVHVADVMMVEAQVLRSVGDKGREAYMMSVHQGESAKEIARRLDLSERTVENHIFRTRTKVRIALRQAL
jgi:RNA polymerase sigma-70 factor (ECF subfamily)